MMFQSQSLSQKRISLVQRRVGLLVAALGAAALLPCHSASAQTAQYSVIDLGSLGGTSRANGLNANGQVVGSSVTTGTDAAGNPATAAFLYNGTLRQINTLGGTSSAANAVNASGQIVGNSQLATDAAQRAFLSSGTGPLTNLGTLAGGLGDTNASYNSQANGINDSGQVVGFSSATSTPGSSVFHAFLYTAGGLRDLGTLPGGSTSTATAIDALGRVVGNSTTNASGSVNHAFVWIPATPNAATGTMVDLGVAGGAVSNALAINTVGQIAGSFTTTVGNTHAFRTTTPLTPINPLTDDLGTLGGTFSQATSLNLAGTTVGFSTTTAGALSAFIYGTGMMGLTDLNTLISPAAGWTLTDATGINDRGQIVGFGFHNGLTRAFLLTPTPEPSSFAALALGILGIGMLAARKRRYSPGI